MSAVLENKPIDRVPTTKTFIEYRDFMFAPFFRKVTLSRTSCFHKLRATRIEPRLNISHEAGSVSSSFWLILAAGEKNHSFGGAVIGANRASGQVSSRVSARVNQGRRPNSLPSCTACVLRLAPSLSKTRLEWVFTVLSLTKR